MESFILVYSNSFYFAFRGGGTGVEQISAVVQTNSATAEESAAASEELSGQAHTLKDLISKFQLNDEKEYLDFINKRDDDVFQHGIPLDESKY